MKLVKQYWEKQPLLCILLIAIILRLIAAFFSQGYAMHDDHYLVIEPSQSWADGTDYANWLPSSQVNPKPEGHSFFYVGIHYLFFKFIKLFGLNNPQVKMLIIRLLHAFFSMIAVFYSYKITEKIYNQKIAKQVGLFIAALWFMPFLSVRNLVEIVCIPFLIYSVWLILNAEESKKKFLKYFIAGLIIGIGFSIRFQTIFFIGGLGLAILINKKYKEAIYYGIGALISIFLIQGIVDIFIWGRPFAELQEYIVYNIANRYNYGVNRWDMYFLVITGILIPPLGLMIFIGFFRNWKKNLIIFLPTLLFFAFHTYFPNKQERFILTIVPFFVILGLIGIDDFITNNKYGKKAIVQKNIKISFIIFWILNLIILPFLTTTYTKKSRVESMNYLSKYKNIQSILIEDTNHKNVKTLPIFYMNKWICQYQLGTPERNDSSLMIVLKENSKYVKILNSLEYFNKENKSIHPDFVLFCENTDLEKRINEMKHYFPELEYETTIEPGFVDKIMYKINPTNKNQSIYIFKTNMCSEHYKQ